MSDLKSLENTLENVLSLVEKIDLRLQQQESTTMKMASENRGLSQPRDTDFIRLETVVNAQRSTANFNQPKQVDRENSFEKDAEKSSKAMPVTRPMPIATRPIGSPWPRGKNSTRVGVGKGLIPSEIADQILHESSKNLGNAWVIPADERVQLAFTKQSLQEGIPHGEQDRLTYGAELRKRVEKICDYNSRLSTPRSFPLADWGRRFQIFDCYFQSNALDLAYYTYTVGSDKSRPFYVQVGKGSDLREPLSGGARKPPWRRIVLCQGSSSMKRGSSTELNVSEPCEYFDGSWFSYLHGYRHHLELSLESTSHEFNYFEDERCEMLFQLIYFDLVEEGSCENEVWPHGTLYRIKKGPALPFRKAAFTIFIRKPVDNDNNTPMTIVIYSASNFYKKSETVPTAYDFGSFSPLVTIFSVLLQASWTIILSWKRLERAMQMLVSQDEHSFMNPEEYVGLMYDDATFSRSRLYFWAIGTLSEFEKALAQYISQLELFHRANVAPILREASNPTSSWTRTRELDKDFQEHVGELRQIRQSFKTKLIRVQGLQDALFTGSSVIEARQSRILGENVQLLTFASIFFLPLGFATALWAVPAVSNTYPSTNSIVYASCIIGGLSYLTIFNLKRLINLISRLFAIPAKALGRKDERFPKPEDLPVSKWYFVIAFFIKCLEKCVTIWIPRDTRLEVKKTFNKRHLQWIWKDLLNRLSATFQSLWSIMKSIFSCFTSTSTNDDEVNSGISNGTRPNHLDVNSTALPAENSLFNNDEKPFTRNEMV